MNRSSSTLVRAMLLCILITICQSVGVASARDEDPWASCEALSSAKIGPWPPFELSGASTIGQPYGTLLTIKAVMSEDEHEDDRQKRKFVNGKCHITEVDGKPADCLLTNTEYSKPLDWGQLHPPRSNEPREVVFRAFPVVVSHFTTYRGKLGMRGVPMFAIPTLWPACTEHLVVTEILKPTHESLGYELVQYDIPPGGSPPKTILFCLIRGLRDGHAKQSLAVLSRLGNNAASAADALLERALDPKETWEVRYWSATLLRTNGPLPTALLPWALSLAKEQSPEHRSKGLYLLGSIGALAKQGIPVCAAALTRNEPPAVPLGNATDDRPNIWLPDQKDCADTSTIAPELAAWALGQIGIADDQAVQALADGAKDYSQTVRHQCLLSLRLLPLSAANPLVARVLADPNEHLAAAAITALGNDRRHAKENVAYLSGLLDHVAQNRKSAAAIEAVRRLGPAASQTVPKLVQAFDRLPPPEFTVEDRYRRGLGSGWPFEPVFISNYAEAIVPKCRLEIVRALDATKDGRATQLFQRAIVDNDLLVACAAFRALGSEKGVPLLKSRLESRDPQTAKRAVLTVCGLQASKALTAFEPLMPALIDLLKTDETQFVTVLALRAIANDSAIAALRNFADRAGGENANRARDALKWIELTAERAKDCPACLAETDLLPD